MNEAVNVAFRLMKLDQSICSQSPRKRKLSIFQKVATQFLFDL